MNFLFLLTLNNVAFFTVAGLSGYLSEQLQSVGRELTRAGHSLKASLELNRVILENMPLGMVSFNKEGRVMQYNSSALQIFQREKLDDENWFQLLPDYKGSSELVKSDIKYKAGQDKETQILGLTVSSLYSSVVEEHVHIALVEDLTQVRQLEYSVRQNEKMAAVGGLAAGIAHEIRNPLASISGSVEMLSQNANSEDDRKLMKIILREIDRLNNLITEFLDFSSPEKPPTETVELAQLLNEILSFIQVNKQVRADVNVIKDFIGPISILGRADKLKQAFLNIILNAYQAMQDVPVAELKISMYDENGHVVLRIKDSGGGMSEATRKRMFEPFHTTKAKGTGLGLAVTHKILEGHRAQVFVESEPGKGTEFILHFPLAQSEMK